MLHCHLGTLLALCESKQRISKKEGRNRNIVQLVHIEQGVSLPVLLEKEESASLNYVQSERIK